MLDLLDVNLFMTLCGGRLTLRIMCKVMRFHFFSRFTYDFEEKAQKTKIQAEAFDRWKTVD